MTNLDKMSTEELILLLRRCGKFEWIMRAVIVELVKRKQK
jgi:hypothetical protein